MYTRVYRLYTYVQTVHTYIHTYTLHISQKKNYLQAQTNQVTVNEKATATTTQEEK